MALNKENLDLHVYVGQNLTARLTVYQAGSTRATIAAGTALTENVSGWTGEWVWRRKASYSTALLTVAWVVIDGPNGLVTFSLVPSDTILLEPEVYEHMARRTGSGLYTPLCDGLVNLRGASAR